MESCVNINSVCLRFVMLLVLHMLLCNCSELKTIPMNFNCSVDGLYFKCTTRNVNIAIGDKNATLLIVGISRGPQEILIECSKMNFVPSEIFAKYPELREFIAKNVSIQEIYPDTFAQASQLYYLILSQNQIRTLVDFSFKNASKLQSLKLQNNQIDRISLYAFFGLTQLRNLELSYNKIVNLPLHLFRDLESLETLQLDHNFIKVISFYQFAQNNYLVTLNLENNEIVTIDSGSFDNFTKLEQLRLNRNICVDRYFTTSEDRSALICCSKSYEKMIICKGRGVVESNQTNTASHVPLIFFLFVSMFVNIFALGYFCIYKRRMSRGLPESFELITDDVDQNALEVY